MTLPASLVVFGERSTAVEVRAAALAAGMSADAVRLVECPPDPAARDALCRQLVADGVEGYQLGFTDHRLRAACVASCEAAGLPPRTVVHPAAWVADCAVLGDGVFVGANATVSVGARIGRRSIVHHNATIGHGARLGEDTLALPGARVSGDVAVGERCLLGSNCFLFQGVVLGDDVFVDALTYIKHDVASGQLASSRQTRIVPRVDLRE